MNIKAIVTGLYPLIVSYKQKALAGAVAFALLGFGYFGIRGEMTVEEALFVASGAVFEWAVVFFKRNQ